MTYRVPPPLGDELKFWAWLAAVVAVTAFGIWFQWFAPCSWHAGTSVKDLPARCLP